MTIKKICIAVGIISLLVPLITHGQIKITEIMYDPQGGDTKREWIEVLNMGTTAVDLSGYFFFENNVYHKLVAQAGVLLEPNTYAIIVDSIAEVIAEYSGNAVQIFDSAFSLNNTGETISMADASKQIIDTVTYSVDMGGNNDGNSLQITGDAVITASPTFGVINKTESEAPPTDTGTDTTDTTSTSGGTSSGGSSVSTHIQQESVSKYTPPTTFKIGAGRNRYVTLNTPIQFEGEVSNGEVSPKFLWNFGDFNTEKGKKVTHIYEYEGVYEVVLEGKTSEHTAISRTEVHVTQPQIEITQSTTTIAVYNKSKQEVNIGGFKIEFLEGEFVNIPRNTIIKGGAAIYMAAPPNLLIQRFVYPNGEIYEQFDTIEK